MNLLEKGLKNLFTWNLCVQIDWYMDFQSVDRYIEHSYILDGNELHFHLKNDGKGEFMGKQGRILVV